VSTSPADLNPGDVLRAISMLVEGGKVGEIYQEQNLLGFRAQEN
jgi:hypothetical protein